jgi:hypothetical protein
MIQPTRRSVAALATVAMALALASLIGSGNKWRALAQNATYHNGGQAGRPNIGNWAWLNNHPSLGAREMVWWMKHHWTDQGNYDLIRNGDRIEMEWFNGGQKTGCDVFHVAGPHKVFTWGGAYKHIDIVSDCGSVLVREQVNFRIKDKSKIPLTTQGWSGPGWAVIAERPSFPVPCPAPPPGQSCPSPPETT